MCQAVECFQPTSLRQRFAQALRQVAIVPLAQAQKLRVIEVAFEIARYARYMAQIAALAVALGETGEDAEDLRGALRAEEGEGRAEVRLIEAPIALAQRAIEIEQPVGEREIDIDAGILKQRCHIESRMAEDAVLRVDEPVRLGQDPDLSFAPAPLSSFEIGSDLGPVLIGIGHDGSIMEA